MTGMRIQYARERRDWRRRAQEIKYSSADYVLSQPGHGIVDLLSDVKFSPIGGARCGTLRANLAGMLSGFRGTASGSNGRLAGVFNAAVEYGFAWRVSCGGAIATGNDAVKVSGPMSIVSGPYPPPCQVGFLCQASLTQGGAGSFSSKLVSGVAAGMSMTSRAMRGALMPATAQISGTIVERTGSPVRLSGVLVNNANPVPGAPLNPGTVRTIHSQYLAGSTAEAAAVPLPVGR